METRRIQCTTKLNAPNKILKCEDQRELRHFFVLEGH